MHLAPVCSSFSWINSFTHRRTAVCPLGSSEHEYVALGNALVERSVALATLAFHRGVQVLLEQPRNSQLQIHPMVQWLLEHLSSHGHDLFRQTVYLGEYGAESLKPIWLYSLRELELPTYDVDFSAAGSSVSSSQSSQPVTFQSLGNIMRSFKHSSDAL